MAKILIIGCGDIGYPAGMALQAAGHQITGLKRQPDQLDSDFPMIRADICQVESLKNVQLDFDAVLFIVSPDNRQESAYQRLFGDGLNNVLAHFAKGDKPPKWLMVSSTSVYGQNQGEWVDENSATQPDNPCSQWLVAAEQSLWADNPENCIVRFSGIYGAGRESLLRRAASGASVQYNPPLYTNRIHRDDCVAVLVFLIEKQLLGELAHNCYLATDDYPVTQWEIMNWLAEQYGYPPPVQVNSAGDTAQNKRCLNTRLKSIGYRFLYPGYRDGYKPGTV